MGLFEPLDSYISSSDSELQFRLSQPYLSQVMLNIVHIQAVPLKHCNTPLDGDLAGIVVAWPPLLTT